MRYEKAVVLGIAKSDLDKKYWDKIDSLVEQKVVLPKNSQDTIKELKDADCLLVAFGNNVTKEHIDAAPNLKYIGVLAVAFSRIDVDYAKEKGVVVSNIAGYCTESVAEFIIASLLENIRHLERGKQNGRKGEYGPNEFSARELKGSIFAVLGLGTIGRRTAQLAQGFGADVRYYSRTRKYDAEAKGIKYQDADSLLSEADFISLNFALNSDTEGFLDAKRIEKLKPGAVMINTCPMGLVDIEALEKRLQKEDITFITDHAYEIPKENIDRLSEFESCILYPVIAFVSEEARIRKQELFVDNMENFLNGNPTNVVI